jgi:hypothetical protein
MWFERMIQGVGAEEIWQDVLGRDHKRVIGPNAVCPGGRETTIKLLKQGVSIIGTAAARFGRQEAGILERHKEVTLTRSAAAQLTPMETGRAALDVIRRALLPFFEFLLVHAGVENTNPGGNETTAGAI